MCMIVHRDLGERGQGSNIPNKVIDTALTRHPDGFGVAWRDADGLRHEKFGPDERGAFRKLLKAVDRRRDIEYVAHFRFATHGPETEELAHPYSYTDPVEGEVLVFHNGIISIRTKPDESDTQVFVRDVLATLPSGWWRQMAIVSLVDMAIGWSKIVLMTATETVNLHKAAGETDGGIWYSSAHKPYPVYSTQITSPTSGKGLESNFDYSSDEQWEKEWDRLEGGAYVRKNGTTHRALVPYVGNVGANYSHEKGTHPGVIHVVGQTTQPMGNAALWQHEGHTLTPLQTFDFKKDGNYECAVVCDSCGTSGDVYLIDGKAYIDIPHVWTIKGNVTDDDENAEEAKYRRILDEDDEAEYERMFDEALARGEVTNLLPAGQS